MTMALVVSEPCFPNHVTLLQSILKSNYLLGCVFFSLELFALRYKILPLSPLCIFIKANLMSILYRGHLICLYSTLNIQSPTPNNNNTPNPADC